MASNPIQRTLAALRTAAGAALASLALALRQRRTYLPAEALVISTAEALQPRRFLAWPSAVNLRDIGGYAAQDGRRVRWGQIYRGGTLAGLSEADQQALAQLELRFIGDLRSPVEVAQSPDALPAALRAVYVNLPSYSEHNYVEWVKTLFLQRHELDRVFENNYVRLADRYPQAFGAVLQGLSDPAHRPALIHCTSGRDRTGISIALLLSILGVPEEAVVADYALSNLAYDRICAASQKDVQRLRGLGLTEEEIRPIMSAQPESMRRMLAHLRTRYGSVEAYLCQAAGLRPADLARLRAALLE